MRADGDRVYGVKIKGTSCLSASAVLFEAVVYAAAAASSSNFPAFAAFAATFAAAAASNFTATAAAAASCSSMVACCSIEEHGGGGGGTPRDGDGFFCVNFCEHGGDALPPSRLAGEKAGRGRRLIYSYTQQVTGRFNPRDY